MELEHTLDEIRPLGIFAEDDDIVGQKELTNGDAEENVAANFVIMRHLAGFLTGQELMRFREVCPDWSDWSTVWFRKEHPPLILSTSDDIKSFIIFLEGRQGHDRQPFTRVTINGYRNQICPMAICNLFSRIGTDIRVLSLPKSQIYHLTPEAAWDAEEDGTGPPPEPWNIPHNEAVYLQLVPNLTYLEIGIGFFPDKHMRPIPHLPYLHSLQLNFDNGHLEGIQGPYIQKFIQENRSIRRIHFNQADSIILPLVDGIWYPGLSLDLTLTVLEPDVERFRDLLAKVDLYGLSLRGISPFNFGLETIRVLQYQKTKLEKLSFRLDAVPFGVPVLPGFRSPVWFPNFPKLESLTLGVHDHWWIKQGIQFPMVPMREGQFPALRQLEVDAQLGFPSFAHRVMENLATLKLWSYRIHVPFSSYVPNLKSLTIPNFQDYQVQALALRHIVNGFPKLETLDLNFMPPSTNFGGTGNNVLVPSPNPQIWDIFTGGASPMGIKKILKFKNLSDVEKEEEISGKGLGQLTALQNLNLVWCGNEGLKALLLLSVTGKLHRLHRICCRSGEEEPSPKVERELKVFHDRVKLTTWKISGPVSGSTRVVNVGALQTFNNSLSD